MPRSGRSFAFFVCVLAAYRCGAGRTTISREYGASFLQAMTVASRVDPHFFEDSQLEPAQPSGPSWKQRAPVTTGSMATVAQLAVAGKQHEVSLAHQTGNDTLSKQASSDAGVILEPKHEAMQWLSIASDQSQAAPSFITRLHQAQSVAQDMLSFLSQGAHSVAKAASQNAITAHAMASALMPATPQRLTVEPAEPLGAMSFFSGVRHVKSDVEDAHETLTAKMSMVAILASASKAAPAYRDAKTPPIAPMTSDGPARASSVSSSVQPMGARTLDDSIASGSRHESKLHHAAETTADQLQLADKQALEDTEAQRKLEEAMTRVRLSSGLVAGF